MKCYLFYTHPKFLIHTWRIHRHTHTNCWISVSDKRQGWKAISEVSINTIDNDVIDFDRSVYAIAFLFQTHFWSLWIKFIVIKGKKMMKSEFQVLNWPKISRRNRILRMLRKSWLSILMISTFFSILAHFEWRFWSRSCRHVGVSSKDCMFSSFSLVFCNFVVKNHVLIHSSISSVLKFHFCLNNKVIMSY